MDNEQTNIPYQGPYTGEQIDQAIERALSQHVDEFNGRTGVVTPQAGDYSADKIRFSPVSGMTSENVQEAVSELFQSVSEGKALIASAVTDKGVPTAADATFQTMHDNILAIEAGGGLPDGVYSITLTADPPEGGTVSGGGYASAGMTCNAQAIPAIADGYVFDNWSENGNEIQSEPVYRFPVTADRALMAHFIIPTYMSGRDWWASTMPETACWYSLAYGGGKFVAITFRRGNYVSYSEDGASWKQVTLPYEEYDWTCLTYGGGVFFALEYLGSTQIYSKDGINWTQKTGLPSVGNKQWGCATYGNGIFVVLAELSNNAIYSYDGLTWLSTTLPVSASWESVIYGNGKFVAVGGSKIIYSEDGVNWIETINPSGVSLSSIAYGNDKFVAISRGERKTMCSQDGVNWGEAIDIPSTIPGNFISIVYGNGIFAALRDGRTSTSQTVIYGVDGANWNMATLPSYGNWAFLAYGNKRFVALTGGNIGKNVNKAAYSFTGNEAPA